MCDAKLGGTKQTTECGDRQVYCGSQKQTKPRGQSGDLVRSQAKVGNRKDQSYTAGQDKETMEREEMMGREDSERWGNGLGWGRTGRNRWIGEAGDSKQDKPGEQGTEKKLSKAHYRNGNSTSHHQSVWLSLNNPANRWCSAAGM